MNLKPKQYGIFKKTQHLLLHVGCLTLAFSCVNEKTDPQPGPAPIPKLYPLKMSTYRTGSPDSVVITFTYNTENQITREDVYTNQTLNSYKMYTYNAAGKQKKKVVYNPDGSLYEQDEITYNSAGLPEELTHSMAHSGGVMHLHHTEQYTFNAEGKLLETVGLWPQNTPKDKATFRYSGATTGVTLFDDKNQFAGAYDFQTDGRQNPFFAVHRNYLPQEGNEVSRIFKDENGNTTFTVFSTITSNPEGYPLKIVKTQSDGLVITERYRYR